METWKSTSSDRSDHTASRPIGSIIGARRGQQQACASPYLPPPQKKNNNKSTI